RLQKAGLPAYGLPFSTENLRGMATATLDAFNERLLSLYPEHDLVADLKSLRVKETGNSFRLFSVRGESSGTAHSDLATALSLSLLAAKRLEYSAPRVINGPLLCWP